MGIVSPVDLKIIYDVKKAQYFSVGLIPIVKNNGNQGRHKQQVDNFKRNLNVGLMKIKQKLRQDNETNSSQNKPQMLSLLNKVSQSNSQIESLTGYYKGGVGAVENITTQVPKKMYRPLSKLKNNLTYPTMKFYDDEPEQLKQSSKIKCALGKKLQEQISNWVLKEMAIGKKITRHDLKLKALQIRQNPSFKASRTWIRTYFQRYPHIKHLVMKSQAEIEQGTKNISESQSEQSVSLQRSNQQKKQSSYQQYSDTQQPQESFPRKKKQIKNNKKFQKQQQANGDQIRQDEKAVYDDGQQKIIIFKGITNEMTESKYTSGRRHRKSYVNGNGYNFKNHSRFKDAYFNDLNKMKQVNNVIIVKASEGNEKDNKLNQENQVKAIDNNLKQDNNKGDSSKNTAKIDNADSRDQKSKKRRKQSDNQPGSKLKSYLNLMRYETVKIQPAKQ